MLLQCGQGNKQLRRLLLESIQWEEDFWHIIEYPQNPANKEETSASQRDQTVRWMIATNLESLHFLPETVSLAISLLDNFLKLVQAPPRYLRCMATSCLFLSAKSLEEDDRVPSTFDLIAWSKCGCSVAEVLRMEIIIVSKLDFNIRHRTPIDFLQQLHAMLLLAQPSLLSTHRRITAGQQLSLLTSKLIRSLADQRMLEFRPSCLALALISLELGLFTPDWLAHTIFLQEAVQISNTELIRCQEVLARALTWGVLSSSAVLYNRPGGPPLPPPVSTSFQTSQRAVNGPRPNKRKVSLLADDDMYDGIKRLYGEEGSYGI